MFGEEERTRFDICLQSLLYSEQYYSWDVFHLHICSNTEIDVA